MGHRLAKRWATTRAPLAGRLLASSMRRSRASRYEMKLGTVIGRVTLSQTVPALIGARWLIVSPFTREHFQQGTETPPGMSKEPSLVVYDNIGGGVGQTVGF